MIIIFVVNIFKKRNIEGYWKVLIYILRNFVLQLLKSIKRIQSHVISD